MLKALKDNQLFQLGAGIVVLIGIIWGFNVYVDSRVEKIVTDEGFLRKVSQRVRPYCILDGKGAVLVDGGALAFIDKLRFDTPTNGERPEKVVLTPKEFLPNAPLFTCIDDSSYHLLPSRGQFIDWIFTVRGHTGSDVLLSIGEQPPTWTNRVYRFRLEILQ